jgi:hypothetical protein
MSHYYVEMPNSFRIITNNHKEDQLVMDLEDIIVELEDRIGSN